VETSLIDFGDLNSYSPLQLAYLGDAYYELLVRSVLLSRTRASMDELNRLAVRSVRASTQAAAVLYLKEQLSEEEWDYVRWGRNAKSKSSARHTSLRDYRYATGFECLVGALYVLGRTERAKEIVRKVFDYLEEKHGE
jgi:ribonuclease-3 family protein